MGSTNVENKNQDVVKTRSKTLKKGFKSNENKILISNMTEKSVKRKRPSNNGRGMIYLGHIPHGFYEDEMRNYFSQFGKVLGTFVARSKKTGRSKGYGFVEFRDEEVAKIAAESMNNYLMFNRIIKCRYIPPEERKGRVFESKISPSNCPRKKNRIINLRNNEKLLSNLTQDAYLEKAQKKLNDFKKFFEERGIDFKFQLGSKSNNDEIKTSSKASSEFPSEDEGEECGVLEIDESEHEISFKTPPKVKKVIKKSLNSSSVNLTEISEKNSIPKESSKINLKEKSRKKADVPGIRKKSGKKTENKKLLKSLKVKKKLVVKDISTVANQKTAKNVRNEQNKKQSKTRGITKKTK